METSSRMKMTALLALGATLVALSLTPHTLAATPVQANCLGKDISSFTKISPGFVGSIASALSAGGFDEEILAHKQGIPPISSCPDNGFPTPLH
ncbi:MAG: hypothetical protein HY247_06735 [archaeon]|nr:MAG: hypothetical protein HY247_06735 [archaeon]